MFIANNFLHELFLITRQTTKLRNAFENNMPTDTKLLKTQISEINQSFRFISRKCLGSLLSKIASILTKVAVALAKKYFSSIWNNSCCFSN